MASGDIFWGDKGYLGRIQKIDPGVFNQVDGVSIHPYGVSHQDWCTCNSKPLKLDGTKNEDVCSDNIDPSTGQEKCLRTLSYGNLVENVESYKSALPANVKLWVTEIGIGGGHERNKDPLFDYWQRDYIKNVFDYLQDEAEVLIWYAWTDAIGGAGGEINMGLYDGLGNIKPAGELFRDYSTKNLP